MNDKLLKRRDLILNGNLLKAIALLALPVAMNSFIQAMYNLVDTYFVANIGNMEVAAITFVGPINTFVRAISVGIGVAGTSLIAREIGRGDYKKSKGIAAQLLGIAVFFGILIAGFVIMFSNQILVSAGATEGIMDVSSIYFRLTALSSPFVFINAAFIAIKRADGDTLKTMRINMIAMGIKLVLTYIFIFPMDLGIRGLGYSTIIGTMFVSVYAFYDLFIRQSMLRLSFKDMGLTGQVVKALLIIAVPVIIEKSSTSFSFIIMNKYVIDYGEKVLAGYGIANRVNSMFFSVMSGFAVGLAPIISQNLGAKRDDRARAAIKKTFIVAIVTSVIVIAVFLPFRSQIAAIFAKGDEEVLYHTVNAMSVYSISVIPWAVFQVAIGVFQGTGNTKFSMLISVMRIYVFRIPIVILLSKYTGLGEFSIWYAMLISNTLTGVFGFILYQFTKKNLKLVGE